MLRDTRFFFPVIGALLIGVVFVCGYIVNPTTGVDTAVMQIFVSMRHELLSPFILGLTWFFDPLRAIILTLFMSGIFYAVTKKWQYPLFIVFCVGVSALVMTLIKLFHERPRPPEVLRLAVEHSFSFPSGHTAAASAFFVSLACVLSVTGMVSRRFSCIVLWILTCGAVTCIAMTRLYLAVHWLTDVCAGACVGCACVFVFLPLVLRSQQAVSPARKIA
ncbi:phosphatase PAP2 family protein [Schaalia sp. lx-100]|uniref:phosphatase PAP2 family protein n=1 Tax=Schaalia sp. lx-100 TaxID=2899081 RepID=UPI001E41F453|nr:phosphatase PAP2 family protein [Schaalia sp. lx-100]MCD4557826.1 phosphatase PAP2 family protein [Schaalia sp. lx-100]